MKAVLIHKYGQKNIEMKNVSIPDISNDDVLVEIHAASINPVDFKIRDGKLRPLINYKMPLILGNDFSGTVIKTGKNVTKFKAGDPVYGRPRKSRIGTFAEYIAVHEDDIALKPANLTFEEAAAVPLVGLTTYQAFHDILNLQLEDKILIQAGSGGIGTFAIQLAKEIGAYVATTASSTGKDLVERLGADKVINYREENFEDKLADYDYVYDTLGGDALVQSFKILKPGGKIVSISDVPNARFGKENNYPFWKTIAFRLISRKLTKLEKQYQVQYNFLFMKPSGEQLNKIRELIEAEKIKPLIDQVVPFEDTQKAMEYSESGRAKGKIVIKIK
ncbi:NADP-dependent oxidoreductase [Oceanobacillus jeddahense]|uniref:NADP-dependent oxidoreductase n=1 Tax=Oceanobacillus jeddahense TaxID=1462527 RepID=A0ABY5JYL3_9BACI|nr:NADP-dependent oxidoreductase [Oceanobacillus jeddahense]UUI05510.1 NADP-dependent oxidoreductase [Oceanobacillus jeddahense]